MDINRVRQLEEKEDGEEDSIPLADDDPRDVLDESSITEERKRVTLHHVEMLNNRTENKELEWRKKVDFESLDSIPGMLSESYGGTHISDHINRMCLDPDFSPDEQEEKARLISQVRAGKGMAVNYKWKYLQRDENKTINDLNEIACILNFFLSGSGAAEHS